MANFIKMNANKLKKDGEDVKDLNETIPILVDELQGAMSDLANCWEGPAWAGYQENMAHYIDLLREMYEYMGRFAGNIMQASQDYMRTEQDISADI